ncbi:TetR/AcrR family transcriptional regulator [Chelatococcus reniformis]|uniref:HTH tetR-type domain-containing protein n=1 Tax=Chelatococcus reniformis TaxID=1494448 RepID=A0A916XKZ4_9HYPH|nr:TetR/AcrR family transcriptional regulator [Chelatococcus reniformis]GGC82473.1 hypothetical protein GCM10010994_45490 [Chelatococcus reniformis]
MRGRSGSAHKLAPTTDADSPWRPFEDRRRDRDVKRDAVLRTAAQLFLELGYDRTSLAEVAERLNITKPALYNYFGSKEEILAECYRLGQEMSQASLTAIAAMPGTGLERVGALIRDYAEIMTRDFGQCLVRVDDRVLSPDSRRHVRAGKRLIDQGFRRFISEGVADGSILPCDVKVAAFTVAGALNWIGHWYRPGGELEPQQLGEEFARRLTMGLAAAPQPEPAPARRRRRPPEAGDEPGGAAPKKRRKAL